MRIVRYELELVGYQQIQPLWPGIIQAVKPGRLRTADGFNLPLEAQKIDMWCLDDSGNAPSRPPILGVWIVGTGHTMPDAVVNPAFGNAPAYTYDGGPLAPGVDFEDTCVMANDLVWHVFTSVVGYVQPVETGYGEVSSVDDIANKVAERRRNELQQVADMHIADLAAHRRFLQGPNA